MTAFLLAKGSPMFDFFGAISGFFGLLFGTGSSSGSSGGSSDAPVAPPT
ncbi:hypothetical protein [Rhodococcus erythropolis]|nr:hypothetical protein [Rhodococcus erythropolis]EQM33479.1 hypothetical protein N601_11560 [Rhodococcus erythropolis DN1]